MHRGTRVWRLPWDTCAPAFRSSQERGAFPIKDCMQDFTGKTAIVTGTTGIGKAIAKRLAGGSARVLSCGIDSKANEELAHESKAGSLTIEVRQTDVSRPEQLQAAVSEAVKLFGG